MRARVLFCGFFLLHVRGTLLFECLLTLDPRKPLPLFGAVVFRAPCALVRGLGLLVIRQRSLRLLLLLRAVEFAVVDVHILRVQRLCAVRLRHLPGGGLLRGPAVRFAEQAFYILQQRVDVFCVRRFWFGFLSGLH